MTLHSTLLLASLSVAVAVSLHGGGSIRASGADALPEVASGVASLSSSGSGDDSEDEHMRAKQDAWVAHCVEVMRVPTRLDLPTGTVVEMCEKARSTNHMSDAECFNLADDLDKAYDQHSLHAWCGRAFTWFVLHLDSRCSPENCQKRLLCRDRCRDRATNEINRRIEAADVSSATLARQGLAMTISAEMASAKARAQMKEANASAATLQKRQRSLAKELQEAEASSKKFDREFKRQGQALKTQRDFQALISQSRALGEELRRVHQHNLQETHAQGVWQKKLSAFERQWTQELEEDRVRLAKTEKTIQSRRAMLDSSQARFANATAVVQATESRLAAQRRQLGREEQLLQHRQRRVTAEQQALDHLASEVAFLAQHLQAKRLSAQDVDSRISNFLKGLRAEENGVEAAKAWLGTAQRLLLQDDESGTQTALELLVPESLHRFHDLVDMMHRAMRMVLTARSSNATAASAALHEASQEKSELAFSIHELLAKVNATKMRAQEVWGKLLVQRKQLANSSHAFRTLSEEDRKIASQTRKLKAELMLNESMSSKQIEDELTTTREALKRIFAKVRVTSARKRNVVAQLGQSVDQLRGLRATLRRDAKRRAGLQQQIDGAKADMSQSKSTLNRLKSDAQAEEGTLSDELKALHAASSRLKVAQDRHATYVELQENGTRVFSHVFDELQKRVDHDTEALRQRKELLQNVSARNQATRKRIERDSQRIQKRDTRVRKMKSMVNNETARVKAEKIEVEQRRGEIVHEIIVEVPGKRSAAASAANAYHALQKEAAAAGYEQDRILSKETQRQKHYQRVHNQLLHQLNDAKELAEHGAKEFAALRKERTELAKRAKTMLAQEREAQTARAQLTVKTQVSHHRAEVLLKEIRDIQHQLRSVQALYDAAQARLQGATKKALKSLQSIAEHRKGVEAKSARLARQGLALRAGRALPDDE